MCVDSCWSLRNQAGRDCLFLGRGFLVGVDLAGNEQDRGIPEDGLPARLKRQPVSQPYRVGAQEASPAEVINLSAPTTRGMRRTCSMFWHASSPVHCAG